MYAGRDWERDKGEPCATVIIRGLAQHTTEPSLYEALAAFYPQSIRLVTSRDTGSSRGFAFVDFASVEYAEYFLQTFAGSRGDPNAPQLIIDNRAVTIDFGDNKKNPRAGGMVQDVAKQGRSDWICDKCACQNFARRTECYRCSTPRSADAVVVQPGTMAGTEDVQYDDNAPSSTLVVRGMAYATTEDTVLATFRQFGLVKDARVVRDKITGTSRGFCFVDFHSEEHATHTLRMTRDLKLDGAPVKISYARDVFRPERGGGHGSGPMLNPYAAAALQAAQWSMANGYAGQVMVDPNMMPDMAAAMQQPQYPHLQPQHMQMTVPAAKKPAPLWPPSFEEANAAWDFKADSRYFFEPTTRFYYEPKSKLYYSVMDGRYYRHNPAVEPPYEPWDPQEPSSAPPEDQSGDQASALDESAERKKPISISMKAANKNKLGVANPKNAKKALNDIQKWGTIQREVAQEIQIENYGASSGSGAVRKRALSDAESGAVETGAEQPIEDAKRVKADTAPLTTVTAEGVPVCLLCKRQFKTVEQLKKHESESKLHLENVAKLAAQQAKPKYRDRAEERRALHGQDAAPRSMWQDEGGSDDRPHESVPSYSGSAPIIPPGQSLMDEDNVGNKMLRAMGWQEGKGLGKSGTGITAPVGIEDAQIDSVKTGVGAQKPVSLQIDSNDPSGSYKDSVKRTMRARFEQL